MGKKRDRLEIVRNIIETKRISSQEELLTLLLDMGVEVTQSTLSRDIKELRAVKVTDADKGYVYVFPKALHSEAVQQHSETTIADNVRYIDYSGNIILIRTKPGYAKAVGVMIDAEDYPEVVGTIAGDDTLFILIAQGVDPLAFLPNFDSLHPDLKNLYCPDGRHNSPNYAKRIFF